MKITIELSGIDELKQLKKLIDAMEVDTNGEVDINDDFNTFSEPLFSARTSALLRKAGVKTLHELRTKTKSEIMAWNNSGIKALNEIKIVLQDNGLNLAI